MLDFDTKDLQNSQVQYMYVLTHNMYCEHIRLSDFCIYLTI